MGRNWGVPCYQWFGQTQIFRYDRIPLSVGAGTACRSSPFVHGAGYCSKKTPYAGYNVLYPIAGMLSVCRQKTLPLKSRTSGDYYRRKTLPTLKHSCKALALALTGPEKSTQRTRNIISGPNGFSCSCLKKDWLIRARLL